MQIRLNGVKSGRSIAEHSVAPQNRRHSEVMQRTGHITEGLTISQELVLHVINRKCWVAIDLMGAYCG